MPTHMNDFASAVAVHAAVSPSIHTTAFESDAVDLIDSDGACFAIQQVGGFEEGPTWNGAIEESADGENWNAIEGAEFTGVTEANNTQVIRFTRTARYVRYAATVTGEGADLALAVLIGEQRKTF